MAKARSPVNHENQADDTMDPAEQKKVISPKHQQRLDAQKERHAKKIAKRQAKAMQKEHRAEQKELREALRERKMQEEMMTEQGPSAKEMQEMQRLQEEKELLEKEFFQDNNNNIPQPHTKKSALVSNRLGGKHMA